VFTGASGGPLLLNDEVVALVTAADKNFTYSVNAAVAEAELRGWGVVASQDAEYELIATIHRIAVLSPLCRQRPAPRRGVVMLPPEDKLRYGFELTNKRYMSRGEEIRPRLKHRFRNATSFGIMANCEDDPISYLAKFEITKNESGQGRMTRQITVAANFEALPAHYGKPIYEVEYSVEKGARLTSGSRLQRPFPFKGRRFCKIRPRDNSISQCFESRSTCQEQLSVIMWARCQPAPSVGYCFEAELPAKYVSDGRSYSRLAHGRRYSSCFTDRVSCEIELADAVGVLTQCLEVRIAQK
jgi:hypothetical protein